MVIVELMTSIYQVVKTINDVVETAKNNKKKCQELGSRIVSLEKVVHYLSNQKDLEKYVDQLSNIKKNLDDCLSFVSKVSKMGKFEGAWRGKSIQESYKKLMEDIATSEHDLTLAIAAATKGDAIDIQEQTKKILEEIAKMNKQIEKDKKRASEAEQKIISDNPQVYGDQASANNSTAEATKSGNKTPDSGGKSGLLPVAIPVIRTVNTVNNNASIIGLGDVCFEDELHILNTSPNSSEVAQHKEEQKVTSEDQEIANFNVKLKALRRLLSKGTMLSEDHFEQYYDCLENIGNGLQIQFMEEVNAYVLCLNNTPLSKSKALDEIDSLIKMLEKNLKKITEEQEKNTKNSQPKLPTTPYQQEPSGPATDTLNAVNNTGTLIFNGKLTVKKRATIGGPAKANQAHSSSPNRP